MSRKKIGIVGWKTGDNSFGVTLPYLKHFNKFGQIEILTPRKDIITDLDLLVLPGGADLNPWSYRRVPDYSTSNPDVMKQYFYENNLSQYIENNTPIFGICLGFQQLGSYFKCELTQDMSHPYSPSDSRWKPVHSVYICNGMDEEGNPIIEKGNIKIKGKGEQERYLTEEVNSLHHQGIYMTDFNSNELKLTRLAKDGYVEAFEHKTLPIVGVQWHPEELEDDYSQQMVERLLNK